MTTGNAHVLRTVLALAIGLVAIAGISFAATSRITAEFELSPHEFTITREDGYHVILLDASFCPSEPGLPLVPSRQIRAVLPQGAEDLTVRAVSMEWRMIPGEHLLYPIQPPRPLTDKAEAFVGPDDAVYSSDGPVPASPVSKTRLGNAGGFRVASLVLTPFRYWPSTGRLEVLNKADVVFEFTVSGPAAPHRTRFQITETARALESVILNPEDMDVYAPPLKGEGMPGPLADLEEYRHIIITSEGLAPSLQALSAWRTKHGYPSQVKTVSEIAATYPGWDDAERVRNFIADAYETWGTLYFTLAGDMGVAPVRYIGDPLGGPAQCFPSDLYFSDLDGTWDEDGDHIYGEEEDSLDFFSDVYVGRASVETPAEAGTFVTKTLTYEKTPPAGYIENCLLPGVQLWANYWGAFVNDSIAAVTPTPPWNDLMLYERTGTVSRQGVIDAINSGVGFCHYSAHGNENGLYFAGGDTVLHSTDVLSLTNGDRLGIHNSIACISGALDTGEVLDDCFAEHLMNHTGGGAVACIMNSRVGLGTPPTMGPSEHLSLEFYHKAFDEGMHRIGMAHGISKDAWCGTGDWAYDFCLAELNLFGDAALSMWTAEPRTQTVDHPPTVPTAPGLVTVSVESGGTPLEGALVCLMSGAGEVYDYGETNSLGEVVFSISPSVEDTLHVTSTAPNHLPYEGFALIEGDVSGLTTGEGDQQGGVFQVVNNPLVGGAVFRFSLRETGGTGIRIFDVSGRLVRNLELSHLGEGVHEVDWDATDDAGRNAAPGVYFASFRSDDTEVVEQMVLLK